MPGSIAYDKRQERYACVSRCALLQRHAGRSGTDIVGIARIPLSRIPIHDDAAIAALAEQAAVSDRSHCCLCRQS